MRDASLTGWGEVYNCLIIQNLVPTGIYAPHQRSGNGSHRTDSPTLNPSPTQPPREGVVRKRHSCDLHKPPNGYPISQAALRRSSLILLLSVQSHSNSLSYHISGVENQQADFLNCQHMEQGTSRNGSFQSCQGPCHQICQCLSFLASSICFAGLQIVLPGRCSSFFRCKLWMQGASAVSRKFWVD